MKMQKHQVNQIKRDFEQNGIRMYSIRSTINRPRGVKEIRTSKHSAIAIGYDELGNMTIVNAAGGYRQFVTPAEMATYER